MYRVTGRRGGNRLSVPVDRPAQALFDRHARRERQHLVGPRGRGDTPQIAAALRGVEHDAALEAAQLGDQFHQLGDRDLGPRRQVDEPRRRQPLGGQQQAVGEVFDEQEIPRRRAVAPDHEVLVAEALDDGRRDHVRVDAIEVIARSVGIRREHVDDVQPVLEAIHLREGEHVAFGLADAHVRGGHGAVMHGFFAQRRRRGRRIGQQVAERHALSRHRRRARLRAGAG